MQESVSISNLKIGYPVSKGQKIVAQNLNASLIKGEMTCLLGSNGTGKSTLMKTICGFLNPLSGNISIDSKNIISLDEKKMSKLISIVLTERIVVPNATTYELVAFGRSPFTGFLGRLSQKDKEIIDKSIEMCGISHKKHSLLTALSDGERQKATIAKALVQDTPIIILDEPTAFLDLPARVEIMQLLRKLTSETKKSVLMSTHDLDLALQMSDKIWLLQANGITAGSPEDLLLQNAFQSMFNKEGIEFDNKTGMFKVAYSHQTTFPVQGHGFEYVLLRRALMRKGIKPVKAEINNGTYINIKNNTEKPFELRQNGSLIIKTGKVEEIIKETLLQINSLATQNILEEVFA